MRRYSDCLAYRSYAWQGGEGLECVWTETGDDQPGRDLLLRRSPGSIRRIRRHSVQRGGRGAVSQGAGAEGQGHGVEESWAVGMFSVSVSVDFKPHSRICNVRTSS
jgi:hypothetical protein